jgi:hypothetical protein
MPFVILPTNSISGGYDITNSLRFNSGSSDYLTRTPASAGNRKTFTYSSWIKIKSSVAVASTFGLTAGGASGTPRTEYDIISSGQIRIGFNPTGSAWIELFTTPVYRDPSAWYHTILSVDTTQATSTNRVKFYVNGSEVALTGSYPSQNTDLPINNNIRHGVGVYSADLTYSFDGYIAETHFIDGQQLTPSSFGETDFDTGIWKPKAYTGTYGTNGFYLQFKNSASLGTDSSGNGNTFTVNNLTSVDQSTDTPTNNFCTLNDLSKASDITLSNGNLTATRSTTSFSSVMSTIGVNKGKWYWEAKVVSLGIINFGVTKTKQDGTTHSSVDAGRVMYSSNGTIYDEGFANSPIATGTTFSTNDIIGLGLDCDNGTLRFYKNGTLINTYSNAGLSTNEVTPANGLYNAVGDMNFGSPSFTIASGNTDGAGFGNFEYAVPSGYYALCTKNLANFG